MSRDQELNVPQLAQEENILLKFINEKSLLSKQTKAKQHHMQAARNSKGCTHAT